MSSVVRTTYFMMHYLYFLHSLKEAVYAELFEVFGDSDRLPTIEDLSRLTYLEQCIKESLRRVSVAPLSARVPSEDLTLSSKCLFLIIE